MSDHSNIQNWIKIAGAQGLYTRSGLTGGQSKNSHQGEQDKTTRVLKSLETRMDVILQRMAKR